MRIHLTFMTVLSPLALLAQPAFMASETQILVPNQVVATGPHERLWQSITVDAQGVTNVNSYSELATGLMFWNSATSRFEESKEEFSIAKSGYAIATNGQHQVILAPDISSLGSVDLLTPSGQRLVSNPRFLSFTDDASGKSVLIAEVTNCLGELAAPNVVLYPKCFDTLRAALSYTYTRSGFEQDVILYQKVSPEDYDLDPASVRLEMWSEFLTEATPRISATDPSADQTLDFDQMRLGHGVAYMLNSQTLDTIGLEKAWVEIDSRRFLVESVPYLSVKPMLDKLQASASRPSRTEVAKVTFKDRRKMVTHLSTPKTGAGLLASIKPGQANREAGVLLDYSTINTSQTNYTFKGDSTYWISANVSLFGSNTTFEAGAVIKETNGVSLTVNTPITWLGSAYRPVVLTSKDDDSAGDQISGSTGSPGANYYAKTALVIGVTNTVTLKHLRVANAQTAISLSGGTGHVLGHAQIVTCQNGIAATNTDFSMRNALFWNVFTNFTGSSSTGRVEHLTADTAVYLNNNLTRRSLRPTHGLG